MNESRLLQVTVSGDGPALFLMHGLFGSSRNWQSLATRLARKYTVYNLDLRNHGASFHDAEMNYDVMALDVFRLILSLDLPASRVLGHSMGGKTAMILALKYPRVVSHLLVADIAPVSYEHEYDQLLGPLMSMDLTEIKSRAHADQMLQPAIVDTQLRNFLLHNLQRVGADWSWKVNLSAIKENIELLTGFPETDPVWQISIPACFLRGQKSDYVGESELTVIKRHFSDVRIETIANAGHWLHAEQPEVFLGQAEQFFE